MTSPVGAGEEIVEATRSFVDREIMPVAMELERTDTYPADIIKRMADLRLFAMLISLEHGGLGLDLRTYWRVIAEVARGWMSLGGILNTHSIASFMIDTFGTQEQRARFLPTMSTGSVRAAIGMTEAHAGSDLAAIRTTALRDGDEYVINGQKRFIGSGERAGIVMLLAMTDPDASPRHKGMSMFIAERGPGMEASEHIEKLGYRGFETVVLNLADYRTPADSLLGHKEGEGFYQIMSGSEIGRINVAARAVGVAQAALDEAAAYALKRETFGRPIAEHQGIQFMLAEMMTSLTAASALVDYAATERDSKDRADMEVGMAKLFATETALKVTLDAMRIHGGYGYTKEFLVERLYRDAPQMVVAEGTNEIQKLVIARGLLDRARARDHE